MFAPARSRSLSRSLVAPLGPPALHTLPAEVTLDILELAAIADKTALLALAAVSRDIALLARAVLFRSVVLDNPGALTLFARAINVERNRASGIATLVRKLVLSVSVSRNAGAKAHIAHIVAACTNLHTLVVDVDILQALPHLPSPCAAPSSLTLSAYACIPHTRALFAHTTRLRIAEQGDIWVSPGAMLASLGPLPHLTHLALVRRENANVDNDCIFVDDVRAVLTQRKTLRMLAVSLVALPGYRIHAADGEDVAEESLIRQMLRAVANEDDRLVIIDGRHDAAESTFWQTAQRRATQNSE